jgi:hypothetical protein
MGLWDRLKKIGGAVLLGIPPDPVSIATVALATEHGDEIIEATIDVARQVVKIGGDVYRAIPPACIAFGGDPMHGLLKHEQEEELVLIGEIAGEIGIVSGLTWPALGPVGATAAISEGSIPLYVAGGSIFGKIDYRQMNNEEWRMAQYIFGDSLYDRSDILLTNLGGQDGRAFVYPTTFGSVYVNLGDNYTHDRTTPEGDLLYHELTHVWQAKLRLLKEVYLYDTIPEAVNNRYDFTPGRQWYEYGTEQQASIVEAWTLGATHKTNKTFRGDRNQFALGSPLFRYINGNIRRANNEARTSNGRSVRQLLADGGHRTVREMHLEPPRVWWPKA